MENLVREKLEIGIPAYQSLKSALNKAAELREGGFRGRIHISVNNPDPESFALYEAVGTNVASITLQPRGLGLYGNFRFLANSSEAQYFMWLALDDEPDWGVIRSFNGEPRIATLLYSKHFLQLQNKPFEKGPLYGPFDPMDVRNLFNLDPSAIFGAWDSHWLKGHFPSKDFDWLDSYLLLAVRLCGSIQLVPGQRVIGWDPNKKPHNVKGSNHRIGGWLVHCLVLMARERKIKLAVQFSLGALGRARMIFRQKFENR